MWAVFLLYINSNVPHLPNDINSMLQYFNLRRYFGRERNTTYTPLFIILMLGERSDHTYLAVILYLTRKHICNETLENIYEKTSNV